MLAGTLRVSDRRDRGADEPRWTGGRGGSAVGGHEADDTGEPTEERRRVDVALAIAETEVERARGVPDDGARCDHVTFSVQAIGQVAVRRPLAVGVANHDVGTAGDGTAEADLTSP